MKYRVFKFVGNDLLREVEQSWIDGRVPPSLNSTFITLVPKCENALSFVDLCPISHCNLIYKVISKVIANHLNPILDRSISAEQDGFLKNRQIFKPMGTTQ